MKNKYKIIKKLPKKVILNKNYTILFEIIIINLHRTKKYNNYNILYIMIIIKYSKMIYPNLIYF